MIHDTNPFDGMDFVAVLDWADQQIIRGLLAQPPAWMDAPKSTPLGDLRAVYGLAHKHTPPFDKLIMSERTLVRILGASIPVSKRTRARLHAQAVRAVRRGDGIPAAYLARLRKERS